MFPKGDGVTHGANLFRPLFLSIGKEVPAEQKRKIIANKTARDAKLQNLSPCGEHIINNYCL